VISQLKCIVIHPTTTDENFRQTKKRENNSILTTPLRFDDVNVIRRWLWEHFDGFNDRKFDCSGYESWRLSLSCSIRPPQFSNFSYRAHKTFWQCFKTPTVPLKLSTMHRTLKHDIFFYKVVVMDDRQRVDIIQDDVCRRKTTTSSCCTYGWRRETTCWTPPRKLIVYDAQNTDMTFFLQGCCHGRPATCRHHTGRRVST